MAKMAQFSADEYFAVRLLPYCGTCDHVTYCTIIGQKMKISYKKTKIDRFDGQNSRGADLETSFQTWHSFDNSILASNLSFSSASVWPIGVMPTGEHSVSPYTVYKHESKQPRKLKLTLVFLCVEIAKIDKHFAHGNFPVILTFSRSKSFITNDTFFSIWHIPVWHNNVRPYKHPQDRGLSFQLWLSICT